MNKPKNNRKKNIVKPRVSRKLVMSTAASLMALVIVASLVWNAIKVSVPAEAQNTLSGVSEALKDHGSGESYVILNIVPGTTSEEIPLGTIGDLTSGQSSREKKLAEVLKGYKSYEDIIAADGTTVETKGRLSVAEDYATNAGVGYAYEESTTGGSGWTRIYEGSPCVAGEFSLDDPDTEKAAYKSIIYGTISKLDGGAYRLADDFKTPPVTRIANANAIFKSSGAAKEGFPLSDAIRISGDLEGYDDDIPLYVLSDDGVTYVYADKRIKDIRAEEEEEEEPEETVSDNDITDTETDIVDDGTGDVTDTGTGDGTGTGTGDGTDTGTEGGTGTGTGTGTGDGTNTGTGDGTGTGTGDGTGTGTGDGTGTGTGTGTGDGTGTGSGTDAGTNGATNTVGDVPVESNVSDVTAVTTGVSVIGWIKFIGTDSSVSGNTVPDSGTNANQGTTTTTTPGTNGPAEQNPVTPAAPESGKEPVKSPSLDAETAQSPAVDLDSDDSEEETEYYILEFGEYIKSDEIIEGVDLYTTDDYHEEPIADDAMEISLFSARAASDAITIEDELVYVGEGNGNYTITQTQNKDGVKAYKVYNAPTYFRCYATDYIKEYVLCDNGINIKVNVKSASEVSAEDVRNADLIYIEDANSNAISYITSNNDMSESVVYSILDRAANDLMPVIVDYSVAAGGAYNSAYSGTNYQKLAEILLKTDLYSFFYDMGDVTTMLMNAGSDDYGSKGDADNHYVNNNIYVVNTGDGITLSRGEDFTNPFGETEISGFEEVKSAIDTENKWNDDDDKLPPPSKAMAIQYIINYADGFIGEFRDFAILELQPAAGDTDLNTRNDSRNNTILYWRRPGLAGSGQQIIRSRKSITISVDTESVAQFSGEQSDINDKYQMIFIGLDGQNLNYEDKDTVYNDSSMNGIVYSDTGDTADGSGQRYDGIDITVQKKEALLEFLRAGYPVVVEDNFFVDKTAKDVNAEAINTKYIDSSSNMYGFLSDALSEESCRWCLYTISDTRRNSSDFAAQINVHRPRVEYDWDNSVNALCNNEVQQGQIIQTISAGIDGSYRGYIPYKVTDDVGESYQNGVNARFYMDMNQDGRFDSSEEMTGEGVAVDGGLVTVEFTAPERGIIPWKLEISDTGNEYSRAALNGYFKITQSAQMPVRIVQIIGGTVEGSIDAAFNFELAYDMSDLALLGYYFKDAELLTNTKFDIKTMTVGQLAEELKFNEEYLSGADVLLLGFGPDCSLSVPVEGRDKNVEWYINKYISEGRGVLLSSAASSEASGRLQIGASLLGQKDIKTYNRLGSDKPSSVKYYKYKNLEGDMFSEWNMLSATKINDGAVSHYPYGVSESITVHDNVKIPDYVLDLSSNGASGSASDVTAWYSLGDVEIFDEKTSYGVSPKDAANNYYIYSKGNVVYIGDSRYPYVYDSTVSTVPADGVQGTNNCKLFINALMEAYGVGIKNPKVSIVAGLSDDSADTDSICIPYDEQIKDLEAGEGAIVSNGVLDDTVDVYFKISEPNFAFRKDVTLAFYYEDAAGMPVDVGGKIVNATPFASEVWTVDQNRLVPVNVTSGLDLIPGKIYKIKAPVISLRADDNSVNADIYIVVQSHFIKLGQERHPIGSDSVTLNRAQLFLLE